MKVIDLSSHKEISLTSDMRLSCALGTFDGVHIGHADLLLAAAKKPDGATHSAVWTFSSPPALAFGKDIKLLTTIGQKLELIKEFGVDIAIVEEFESVASLSPEEFVSDVLVNKCRVTSAICGFNFRFGKKAAGDAEKLSNYMSSLGGSAQIMPPRKVDGRIVSSTTIRGLIESGDIELANKMLGRPYSVCLPVLHGKHLGHSLGMPTANQTIPAYSVVPRHGVYASVCRFDGKTYPSVSNVGIRPTVDDGDAVNVETHVIGFDGDIYGKEITVYLCGFIRPETKFSSENDLAAQMALDKQKAIQYFKTEENNAYFKT